MWQRFTETAKKSVYFSQEEADYYNDYHVDVEHLLLGILRETDNTACQALRKVGVMPERVIAELRPRLAPRDKKRGNEFELTPLAKKAIDYAYQESRQLRCEKIQTEHLLLGIIRASSGTEHKLWGIIPVGSEIVAETFQELRITLDAARNAIRQIEEGR